MFIVLAECDVRASKLGRFKITLIFAIVIPDRRKPAKAILDAFVSSSSVRGSACFVCLAGVRRFTPATVRRSRSFVNAVVS